MRLECYALIGVTSYFKRGVNMTKLEVIEQFKNFDECFIDVRLNAIRRAFTLAEAIVNQYDLELDEHNLSILALAIESVAAIAVNGVLLEASREGQTVH